jgi:inward rectifier potassium channel
MSPKGMVASIAVTFEAFSALVLVAMATGLMFAKFSRPTSRILFSEKLVVARRDGKPTLMLRVANERGNDVIEASFRVTILKPETSAEGERIRRLHDLKLLRGDTPLFTLTFLAMHVIDEDSAPHLRSRGRSLRRPVRRRALERPGGRAHPRLREVPRRRPGVSAGSWPCDIGLRRLPPCDAS